MLLGSVGAAGEWRRHTITSPILAALSRVRLLAAKSLAYSGAGVVLALLVTAPAIPVGQLILSSRGEATLGAGGADVLWRNLAVAAVLGPLGVCVGVLVRNQIVLALAVLIAWALAVFAAADWRLRRRDLI